MAQITAKSEPPARGKGAPPVTDFMDATSGVFRDDVFRHLLVRETNRATRYQDFFSVCLAKPDGLNGEDIRSSLSRKIAQFLRSTDMVASLPDGVAIILLHTAGRDAIRVAERVRTQIEHVAFPGEGGVARQVTLSVGNVSFPRDGYNDSVLLSRAQVHLAEAARRGGNQVVHSADTPE
jgi:diguanylate cyclase (GGDEF)-like protein